MRRQLLCPGRAHGIFVGSRNYRKQNASFIANKNRVAGVVVGNPTEVGEKLLLIATRLSLLPYYLLHMNLRFFMAIENLIEKNCIGFYRKKR